MWREKLTHILRTTISSRIDRFHPTFSVIRSGRKLPFQQIMCLKRTLIRIISSIDEKPTNCLLIYAILL